MPRGITLPKYRIYECRTTSGKDALIEMCRAKGVECDRVAGVKSEKRACEILAELLLVDEAFGADALLCHKENGAPYIKDNSACISISHSQDIVCLAVSHDSVIGIDVEFNSEKIVRVRSKFLNEKEQSFISEEDLAKNNLAWCAKEAVYKAALIEGVDLKDGITINDTISQGMLNHNGVTMNFDIEHHSLDGYVVTVASVITE